MANEDDDLGGPSIPAGNPTAAPQVGRRSVFNRITGWFGELADNAELRSDRDRRVMRAGAFTLFFLLTVVSVVPALMVFYRFAGDPIGLATQLEQLAHHAAHQPPRVSTEAAAARTKVAAAANAPAVIEHTGVSKEVMYLMITLLVLMVSVPTSLAFGLVRIGADRDEKANDGPTTPQLEAIKGLLELAKGKG